MVTLDPMPVHATEDLQNDKSMSQPANWLKVAGPLVSAKLIPCFIIGLV